MATTLDVFPTIYDGLFCKAEVEVEPVWVHSFHLTINISVSWPTLVASALANEPLSANHQPPTTSH